MARLSIASAGEVRTPDWSGLFVGTMISREILQRENGGR